MKLESRSERTEVASDIGTFRIYRACRKMSDLGDKTDVEQTGNDFGF